MTLPGGPAAKLGYQYEKWWTLSELVRMLRGETDSLRVEEPGLDGVEFVVESSGERVYHQAKRSHPSGKWSMATLASSGVLTSIGKLLIGHQSRFVFVSGSDARELADLCEGAVGAKSFEEFKARFLGAKERARSYERALEKWQCDGRAAWDVLRRIDVRTISEHELATKVRWALPALFLGDIDKLCDRLAAIVDATVHHTIERNKLLGQLQEAGFLLRKVSNPTAAWQAVVDATDRYLTGVRRNLIQGSLIPRGETAEIIARLTGEQPGDCVLVGQAGTGKTGCVIEVVEKLRAMGIQVLALRLDRHMSATSTTNLGQRLDLQESPALVLNAAAKVDGARAVLIIDQLDAVSAMSGRRSDAFEVAEQLLIEAKTASIDTMVVCRAFDWHNDPRLRSLIREDGAEVVLGELSFDDVRSALVTAGRDAGTFSTRQLELLRLPQNLSLFLNANFTSSTTFASVGDLFDRYWDAKRKLVRERAEGEGDRWVDVMDAMCETMSETQQLSVRKEKLDQFSIPYLEQYVSENVLVADGNSYAFGHESFFDYCFARLFVNKEESLVTLLKSQEQHLFRRAQVRQVLAYLRAADFERYARELRSLLSDEGIRTHIKDLAFALLANVDDPHDKEWDIWVHCVEPQLYAIEEGSACPNRLAVRAWGCIFYAKSWFKQFDGHGMVGGWLSGQTHHLDLATNYLGAQQRYWPDEVAAYLEPFADRGGDWSRRLRDVMFHPGACGSRRHFDLFLRLLDNGTLDVESTGTFGEGIASVYYRLRERHPDWIPEILARQLHRLCALVAASPGLAVEARRFDALGGGSIEAIQEAANNAPASFVRHVLPVVLDMAEAAAEDGQLPPIRDAVWPILMKGSPSVADACLHALAGALGKLAGDDEDLYEQIRMLSNRETHVANHLLLALYQGGGHRYADDAVLAFCHQPWRFDCGYSDSDYWCATETLKAVVPHCKPENRVKLEHVALTYVDPYEKTTEGVRHRGRASFNLLAAIPAGLRSDQARRRYQELERKFDSPATAPKGIVGGFVGPPIEPEQADRMSDDEWRKAIAAYSTERRGYVTIKDDRLRGGGRELAHVFGKVVQKNPERFSRLGLDLPPETNPFYFSALLRGLGETTFDDGAKVAVCQRVFECARAECGRDIAYLLAKANTPLSDQALNVLVSLAIEIEDVDDEEREKRGADDGQFGWGGDIYTNGINTTRGGAALAIGELILEDSRYISRLESALSDLVRVRNAAVCSCIAYALRTVAYHDKALGIDLFLRMDFSEERLFGTRHVYGFIRENLRNEVAKLRGIVVRMLRSSYPEVSRAGARLGCIAAFVDDNARELADESRIGHLHQRLGVADVAAANVGKPAFRGWCEDVLKDLFVDTDVEIRKVAASCFRNIPEDALTNFDGLVDAFSNSEAYNDDAFSLLNALKNSRARLPAMTCLACERFLERAGARNLDMWNVSELTFRLYQQHPNDEWTKRCLDLIDRLCLEAPEASHAFADFER